MYKWNKTLREDRNRQERKNPSFSSSLLDEIYRSTDDGATKSKSPDLKFYREPINKKQSKSSGRTNKCIGEEEQTSSLQRACFIDKFMMDNKASKKANVKQKQNLNDHEMKSFLDHDHDALFFSSTSSSSDSSSGGFFSSDSDSLYGKGSRAKPARVQKGGAEKTEGALFYEQRDMRILDDDQNHYNSTTEQTPMSMALKIFSNLKKMKQQPISPGGRLANFINSLFATGNKFNNAKKTKNSSSVNESYDDGNGVMRSSKSGKVSTCSSASSFSRSCLSKNSPSTRERLSNGAKRSVRFCPVSVIVDEDCRPCGHKCLYDNDYQQIQKKNDAIMRDFSDEDDDDAASCSSSDLFELDHLNINRYCEELPVYETTHVDTNRAIANGFRL